MGNAKLKLVLGGASSGTIQILPTPNSQLPTLSKIVLGFTPQSTSKTARDTDIQARSQITTSRDFSTAEAEIDLCTNYLRRCERIEI